MTPRVPFGMMITSLCFFMLLLHGMVTLYFLATEQVRGMLEGRRTGDRDMFSGARAKFCVRTF